jgi:hypothetical protein
MSRYTIFLPKDYELTLTTDASSTGSYEQLPNPGESFNTPVSIAVSSTVVLGPFNTGQNYALDSNKGEISYAMAPAGNDAASATDSGDVELATIAEINTGTDTERAITPAGLAGSDLQTSVDGLEAYSESVADGALATSGVVLLTKATAGAYTLALPAAADDGKKLLICNGTAAAHVVTLPSESLYDGTATPKDTLTFTAQIGASIQLVAINQTYHLAAPVSAVTITDEA